MERSNLKKNLINILFITLSILILINQCSNSLSTNSDETNKDSKMHLRISNINWKINDYDSEYYPDYTHVTFSLEVDVWVNSTSNMTVEFPNTCGFIPKIDGPDKFDDSGYGCGAALTYKTYPSGFSSFRKNISGWIKEPSTLQLPLGIYDFYIISFKENQQSYHTYLEISSKGCEISNDPMPIGWDEIDWSEKDWGEYPEKFNFISNFNYFYLAFGMVLGVIYILSKLRAKINRINPNILKI